MSSEPTLREISSKATPRSPSPAKLRVAGYTRALAGDICFFEYKLKNTSSKATQPGTVAKFFPILGAPGVALVNENGDALSPCLTVDIARESTVDMLPSRYVALAPNETFVMIGAFFAPFHTERRDGGCVFRVAVNPGRPYADIVMRETVIHGQLCDAKTHKEITGEDHEQPIASFSLVDFRDLTAIRLRKIIPRLRDGSAVKQYFQFIVDGNELKNSPGSTKLKASLLEKRVEKIEGPLKNYLLQMLPQIISLNF